MIQNADEIVRDSVVRTDICIVGGGPAGITLSMELARTGKRVLLLESGDMAPTDEAQNLNAGEVAEGSLQRESVHDSQVRGSLVPQPPATRMASTARRGRLMR